jgi:hypothetical protein
MKFLAGRRTAQLLPLFEIFLDHLDDALAQQSEAAELDHVDRRQLLAEAILLQHGRHPVGEVVGRLGRQILMLHQEVMRVVVDHRSGHFAQMAEQLGEIAGAAVGQQAEIDARRKAEGFGRHRSHSRVG